MLLENLPKLITKEDPYHIHKTIGTLSLINFGKCYYRLFINGHMGLNTYDIRFLLFIHAFLSISSFIFKIPKNRNPISPMIYPEFRLHNLIFSYRSIICTLLFYYKFPVIYNILVCFCSMIFADIVTHYWKEGTTMRNMKFDQSISKETKHAITLFHSKMQIFATLYMIGNIDSAFSPLFAIQFSSLLMTLIRKNIIKTNQWHLLYALSLMMNVFIFFNLPINFIFFSQISYFIIYFFRFERKYNKYLCWSIIFSLYLIVYNNHKIIDLSYIHLKYILIFIYFINYLPMFLFPSDKLLKYFL